MSEPTISPRILFGWAAALALIFGVTFWLMASGLGLPDEERVSDFSTTRSTSAIGYAAFAELARRTGMTEPQPGARGTGASPKKGLVVVGQTYVDSETERRFAEWRQEGMLLILPKWQASRDSGHPGWIDRASLLPEAVPQRWLVLAGLSGRIERRPANRTIPYFDDGSVTIERDMQLITKSSLSPLLSDKDGGVLVGFKIVGGERIYVIADPDFVSNFGLGSGENGAMARNLLHILHAINGPLRFEAPARAGPPVKARGAMQLLTGWPYVIAVIEAIAAALVLVWATYARFGVAAPADPPVKPGKAGLVADGARLVSLAGYQAVVVRRYIETQIQDLATRLKAPKSLDFSGRLQWLDQMAKSRGQRHTLSEIIAPVLRDDAEVSTLRQAVVVHNVFEWKQELLHGRRDDPADRR